MAVVPPLTLAPRDAFRRRVFLAPLAVLLTLDGGELRSVTLDMARCRMLVTMSSHDVGGIVGDDGEAVRGVVGGGGLGVLTVQRTAKAGTMMALPDEVVVMCPSNGEADATGGKCKPANKRGLGAFEVRLPALLRLGASDVVVVNIEWPSSCA